MASILKPKSFFGPRTTAAETEAIVPAIGSQNASPNPKNPGALASSSEPMIAQARAILEQCQRDCEQLRETTRREAVEEGRAVIDQLAKQRAEILVEERISDIVARVDSICLALENATQQWLREWQHETVSLAIKISKAIRQSCFNGSKRWSDWSRANAE